ncbi:MAG: alpha/beta hydrolase [Tolypothrix carrinoi HA7290-LM1]|nr:alpha/beta hydrolase [Tolypothrix carrinoi HA7290-LM1]
MGNVNKKKRSRISQRDYAPFPITHYPLPITHSPLPITHYPFPIL